jgi:hypothetical protein
VQRFPKENADSYKHSGEPNQKHQGKKGLSDQAGIRIRQRAATREFISIDFDFRDGPEPGDAELKRNGLRIFVENALTEPLDQRTLDVRSDRTGPALVFIFDSFCGS